MILCKPVLESGDLYVDPQHVVAVLEKADHDGDFVCEVFFASGLSVDVFDDERKVSQGIRAWKENA